MHFHIRDYLEHVPEGSLVGDPSERAFHSVVARISSRATARAVFSTVGESGLLGLSENDLALLAGISIKMARKIVAARALGELLRYTRSPCVKRSSDILRHLPLGLASLEFEVLFGLALNAASEVKAVVLLSKGGAHGAAVTPKDIFVPFVRLHASDIVLVHNHPSGDPTPSERDVTFTNYATRAGRLLGIGVLDHLIVARRGVTSFAESGLLLREDEMNDETFLNGSGQAAG